LSSPKTAKATSRTISLTLTGLALALAATVSLATSPPAGPPFPAARPPVPGWSASQAGAVGSPLTLAGFAAPGRPATGPADGHGRGHPSAGGGQQARTARQGPLPRRHARTPRQIARLMLGRFGWGRRQFRYLNRLWEQESGWNRYAVNPSSGAYGIPQAVPGSTMASAGPHWRTSARTQIRWGLRYIARRYGSPRRAWRHECAYGWY
jgi:hypothetical protein